MGGFEPSDLRTLRRNRTTGAELMLTLAATAGARRGSSPPCCLELAAALGLSPHKARRLRRLGDAAALFDAAATRPSQGRLSEVELRLWLAGSGCGASEVARVLKLLRSLVARDEGAAFVTFWQWAAGWGWVTHALGTYGVDWRRAL